MSEQRQSKAPAVTRAARVLDYLAGSASHERTVSEIAEHIQAPKSSTLYICEALEDVQLLRRGQLGYRLGRRLAELGAAYIASVNVIQEFYATCSSLRVNYEPTIQLSVLGDGLRVIFLARQDGQPPLRLGIASEIGRAVPANCTASGKALLALLSPSELDERLRTAGELPRLTERSTGSVVELREEIAATRDRGYAIDDEEVVTGIACVAKVVPTEAREDGLVAVSMTTRRKNDGPFPTAEFVEELNAFAASFAERL